MELFPLLLARVPITPVTDLPTSPYVAVLDSDRLLAQRRAALRRRGQELADRIAELVPVADRADRARLLALRRDLHNTRVPSAAIGKIHSITSMDPDITRAVGEWRADLCALEDDRLELSKAWLTAVTVAGHQLVGALRAGGFAEAVELARPELMSAHSSRVFDRPVTSSSRTLWALRWRAALRTTPFGLFAGVSEVRWAEADCVPELAQRRFFPNPDARPNKRVRVAAGQVPATRAVLGDSAAPAFTLNSSDWSRFITDVAWFGAQLQERSVSPDRTALALMLLTAGETAVGLEHACRLLREAARSVGVPGAGPSEVAIRSGLMPAGAPALQDRVATALQLQAPLFSAGTAPDGFVVDEASRRVAFRFIPISGVSGAGGRITFWGGDLMSFHARYLGSGSEQGGCRDADYRAWLRRWPHLVDIRSGRSEPWEQHAEYTDRRIAIERSGPHDLVPSELSIRVQPDLDLQIVETRTGLPVVPAHLGMTAPQLLPDELTLLLQLFPRRRTPIHASLTAYNAWLLSAVARSQQVTEVPPLDLTQGMRLAPRTWIVPRCTLNIGIEERVGQREFLRFHAWTREVGSPAGRVAVRTLGGAFDAQPVDLRYPEGVDILRRELRRSAVVTLEPLPDQTDSPEGVLLDAADGRYLCEYALELAS